jgi:Sodium/hydrogen exchanger family
MHATSTLISPETLLAIMAAVAVAGTLAAFAGRAGIAVPVVVVELLLGIVLGPHVLGLQVSSTVLLFKNLGPGLLFFYAGYEIDHRRLAGRPLRLGLLGWSMSLALAFAAVGLLHWAGVALSVVYGAAAVTSTAVGVLAPALSDSGALGTRRSLPARRGSRRRVRPDPPSDARALFREHGAQRDDAAAVPRCCRGGRRSGDYRPPADPPLV